MGPATEAAVRKALDAIRPLDGTARARAERHLDSLTKPPLSLGRLETIAVRMVAMQGGDSPHVDRKALLIFAADHGVVAQGISAYRAEVTRQMVLNFARGGAAANVLARLEDASVTVVDVGVDGDLTSEGGIVHAKVRQGTRDLCHEDAMTRDECLGAVGIGLEQASEQVARGADCLIAGEMGIGNTTAATAVFCRLFGLEPVDVAGRGTGIDDATLKRKVEAIERALARHAGRRDPLEVLASLGGLEIAAITGVAIAAATRRVPLVVDGFIATAGAAVAIALHPGVRDFLFFGHRSGEQAHAAILRRMEVEPLLDLGLRLGEGTGALLAAHVLEAACRIYREMATFASAGVSTREPC